MYAGDTLHSAHSGESIEAQTIACNTQPLLQHAFRIRNLANLRQKFDVDIDPKRESTICQKIIRTTLRRLGSFHWPAIAVDGISSTNRRKS